MNCNGFFSEDMAPMLGVFEAETSELMASLDDIVARVEVEGSFSPEDIAGLFRCAHTIKGSSAMMGLEFLAALTHKVEDLFDLLRGDPDLARGRVPDIVDHLYSFSDYVKDELARMGDEDYEPVHADSIVVKFDSDIAQITGADVSTEGGVGIEGAHGAMSAADGAQPGAAGDADVASGMVPAASGMRAVKESDAAPADGVSSDAAREGAPSAEDETPHATLKVSFKPDVPMVNARAMVIVRQLGGQVNVRSHEPDDLTDAEAAHAIAEDGLLLVVDAADVDAVRQFLAKNSFVSRIAVLDEVAPVSAPAKSERGKQSSEPAFSGDKYITLRWSSVHDLQDMAGEFLLHTARLKAIAAETPEASDLRGAVAKAARLVDDLVYQINKMAMVSVSAMVPQLSRMVRDMCRTTGKQVSFEVHGKDIEIDRNLYNSISDPLLHIIRNAVDHGIEQPEARLAAGKEARGKVVLHVENLGARVAFRVSDDGRGIDVEQVLAKAEARGMLDRPASDYAREEILEMVMFAGLSTSHEVTQYSGRGVGMDVVSTVVRDFNGRVEIESEPGAGTSMTLFMPVSVTSVESLGFRIGPSIYHMPLFNLNKVYVADEAVEHLSRFEGSVLFEYKKRQLPVMDMHRLFDCAGEDAFYVVCHSMEDEFVIGVDEVLGEFGCANRPLPTSLDDDWRAACPIRNVAVMDDGTVGYALNAALLATLAQGREQPRRHAGASGSEDGNAPLPVIAGAADIPEMAFVFGLGQDWYAIPIEWVERLIPMPPCAQAPRAPKFLTGLANYRNRAIVLFDLAKSAGVEGDCSYVLVVSDDAGELVGLSVTSAIGVRDLSSAVLVDEQPEPRALAAGWYTAGLVKAELKELPITLLARA